MSTAESAAESKQHVSELADPRQRFLARVVEHTLSDGWRSPEDFLRHFPPATLVSSLAHSDDLRVKLLIAATGTHEKIALKKSVSSATEDLELALAEETTTPSALVALYPADDKVRHLNPKQLWHFVAEDEFFRAPASETMRHTRAASRLTFIIDCAISEGILTLKDIADGMTFDQIATSLPVHDVREVVKYAMQIARAGAPLTEERFLAVVPLPSLVSHVPLDHTWQRVVLDRVAAPSGFVAAVAPVTPAEPSSVDIPVVTESPVEEAAAASSPAAEGIAAPEAPAEPAAAAPSAEPPRADEDEVRRRVIERLRVIDRLPPSHADMSTAILLSVESMYADLWAVSDDDEREACIRESFPNQTLLRTAMLALIELLDPSVDTRDPIIRDADVSGLIKIVLFEERRRRDTAPSSSSKRASAPGAQPRSRRSVPPPLPRSSTPPPLPAAESLSGTGRGSTPPPLPAEAASKRDA
jgi:hypothetical protein